jgi:hypothetical protein
MTLKAAKASRDVSLIMESRRALRANIAGAACLQQFELLCDPNFPLAIFASSPILTILFSRSRGKKTRGVPLPSRYH